jgi:hypothetical protein
VDWTVTGDGLLALGGGVLAFLAVIYQTRHADAGLQEQIDEMRKQEDKRAGEVARSTATSILSEIDWFYRYQLATCLVSLRKFDPNKGLRMVPPVPFDPFPVFSGATAHLGDLPFDICTVILSFYGPLWDS